jgi:hypothetical protein
MTISIFPSKLHKPYLTMLHIFKCSETSCCLKLWPNYLKISRCHWLGKGNVPTKPKIKLGLTPELKWFFISPSHYLPLPKISYCPGFFLLNMKAESVNENQIFLSVSWFFNCKFENVGIIVEWHWKYVSNF